MTIEIQQKTSNGLRLVPLETVMLSNRRIFVDRVIDTQAANDFFKQILYFNDEDSAQPIDVFFNSMGGEINSGLLMYDAMQSSCVPIRTYCMGMAYSMAAILFVAGAPGQRYMLQDSKLMLHEPLITNLLGGGTTSSIKRISDDLNQVKKKLNHILAIHTGKTEKQIEKMIGGDKDRFFNYEESIEFGLCDGVFGINDVMKGRYSNG